MIDHVLRGWSSSIHPITDSDGGGGPIDEPGVGGMKEFPTPASPLPNDNIPTFEQTSVNQIQQLQQLKAKARAVVAAASRQPTR